MPEFESLQNEEFNSHKIGTDNLLIKTNERLINKNVKKSLTSLGTFLKKCRLDLGLTQGEISNLSGIKFSDYFKLEKGKKKYLKPEQISALAKTLNRQESEISTFMENKYNNPTKTELGKFIREKREALNISMPVFAKMLGIKNIHEANQLEISTDKSVRPDLIKPLCEILNISEKELKEHFEPRYAGKPKENPIGNLLYSARKRKKLTLEYVANKMGFSKQRMSQIEYRGISLSYTEWEKIDKLAEILGLKVDDIFDLMKPEKTTKFGIFLFNQMIKLRLKPKEMAKRLAIEYDTFLNYLKGNKNPSEKVLEKMSMLFGGIPPELIPISSKRGRPNI